MLVTEALSGWAKKEVCHHFEKKEACGTKGEGAENEVGGISKNRKECEKNEGVAEDRKMLGTLKFEGLPEFRESEEC